MAPVLYRRQRDILQFITQYMQKHGYAPLLGEICDGLGLRSPATVHEHIQNLVEKGILRKVGVGNHRGFEVVDQTAAGWVDPSVEVPLVGYIAAGQPIEAMADPTQIINLPADMVGDKKTYVLQVKGDSMAEAGVLDGDYVIVEEQQEAKNGDIVVALLNDNFATLKKFFREPNHVRLEPANSSMNPIITRNIKIQGKVIGIIRKYIN